MSGGHHLRERRLPPRERLIRHSDMPRAVCQLLWDTLSSGRELFAQINNLDQDGSYYWGIQPLYTRPSC
jgi:hypothetical protein